jgi:hypothetical protein
MSGILWQEMVSQGMARSRSEVTRMVRDNRVILTVGKFTYPADYDDMELPGATVIKTGKHMFRLVNRIGAPGWDQLRCRGVIPVTPPEDEYGRIRIMLSEVSA